jgi:hypothetical protein
VIHSTGRVHALIPVPETGLGMFCPPSAARAHAHSLYLLRLMLIASACTSNALSLCIVWDVDECILLCGAASLLSRFVLLETTVPVAYALHSP